MILTTWMPVKKFIGIPYDCVVISGLLEYLVHWEKIIEKVKTKWLKPGGVCLVSFINSSGYQQNAPVKGASPMGKQIPLNEQFLQIWTD